MSWLHRQMLRALPKADRERYGVDIARVFDEQRRASRWREQPALWAREIHAILSIAARGRRPASAATLEHESRWSGWRQDLQHAARSLVRAPGHALTVIGCLALGLAITLAAFSVLNTILYGELPGIEDRGSVSRLYVRQTLNGGSVNLARFRQDHFELLRQHGPAVASVGGQSTRQFPLRIQGAMQTVRGAFVSGGYFETLGTHPGLGRLLSVDDDAGVADVAVIGDRLWRTRFDASPAALGQVVTVAGRDLRIVGVAPPGFMGLETASMADEFQPPQLWLPLSLSRGWPGITPESALVAIVLRHGPGAGRERVAAEMSVVASRLPWRGLSANPRPLAQGPEESASDIATAFLLFLSVPLALLAIGCANVANLQLARALDRTRELSVRLSLGASRWRVMRLLAVEAALLGFGAVAAAWFGARALLACLFAVVPFPIHADWRVFSAAAGLAAFVVLVCGMAPGWLVASRLEFGALKQTAQSGARPHARLRHTLVGVQVAISLALLILSGLMARTLFSVVGGVPDVAREVLTATINLEQSGLERDQIGRLATALADVMARDGRVQAVGVSVADFNESRYFGRDDPRDVRQFARVTRVTPGYFPAKGIAAVAGRTLVSRDRGTPAVVVSRSLARSLERDGRPALGRRLWLDPVTWRTGEPRPEAAPIEIVGIVADPFRLPMLTTATLDVYVPLGNTLPPTFTLSMRSASPAALIPTLRHALDRLEPRAAQMDAGTLFDGLRRVLGPAAYLAAIAGAIGALALLLAAAGLYAVVAYVVSLRTREFGVRLAVGAAPGDISRLVLGQALRIVGAGAAAGILMTVSITLSLRKIYVGISPLDPWAFLPMLAVLAAAAALASLVPARRAARIDPVVALRSE